MLSIIHGENLVASRKKLTELLSKAKSQQQNVISLAADKISRAQLEAALLSENLFGHTQILLIESLYSLPKSKKKDDFINLISSASIDIILWEKKSLTKTQLKKFSGNLNNYEFKITQKLWSFLDQLSASRQGKKSLLTNFHAATQSDDVEFVFLMLIRQIRLLIQVKEQQAPKMAPFMLTKLNQQTKQFSLKQLVKLHQQLYLIDQKRKQSLNLLDLSAELDLFLFNM